MRVLAALSGGVDSAVAAARAVDAGHDVTAVHLALSQVPSSTRAGSRGCCSLSDARDARRIADSLGIPYYVWDVSAEFERDVVADFVEEYSAGRTPNPCLRCNERIKFAAVLERAVALGYERVCTGHYARLDDGPSGPVLRRAVDTGKDQSYVLGVLTARQLVHSMFPLGGTPKDEVRAEAAMRGFRVAGKPDSTDLCFVPDGDTAGYLNDRLGSAPGQIVDEGGAVLGQHRGAHGFTIGQRRGLRIDTPASDGKPRYVLSIEPATRTVTVGPAEALDVAGLSAEAPRWTADPPHRRFAALAQYRAHGNAVKVEVEQLGDVLDVAFQDPQRGVAPGQSVVLYDGDRVLGAATITSTRRAQATVTSR